MELSRIQVGKAQLSRVHFPALDTLRGVAIVVVLIHNLSLFEGGGGAPGKVWDLVVGAGWVGVQLFFVLSGFLITGILVDDRDASHPRKSFYVRRALRILPLYYLVLIPFFIWHPRPAGEAVWYFVFLSNWSWLHYGGVAGLGHLWSIAVEEQFYLLWPWLVLGTRNATVARVCVALVIGAFAARVALHALHFPDLWLYSSTIARADALAMGALVALAVRSYTWRARLARAERPIAIVVVVGLAAIVVMTRGLSRNVPIVQIVGYTLLALGSALLVARAASPMPPRLLDRPALRSIGKYSYAIYLLHAPLKEIALQVFGLTELSLGRDIVFVIAVSVVSMLLARVTWSLVERPALALKDRLAPRT